MIHVAVNISGRLYGKIYRIVGTCAYSVLLYQALSPPLKGPGDKARSSPFADGQKYWPCSQTRHVWEWFLPPPSSWSFIKNAANNAAGKQIKINSNLDKESYCIAIIIKLIKIYMQNSFLAAQRKCYTQRILNKRGAVDLPLLHLSHFHRLVCLRRLLSSQETGWDPFFLQRSTTWAHHPP